MTEPEQKPLRTVSFVVHAARGVIRDQKARRRAMFALLIAAMVLVFAGSTFLQAPLSPRQHPLGFLVFWSVCGWLTLTAVFLALFDLLMVRLESRRTRRRLQEDVKTESQGSIND